MAVSDCKGAEATLKWSRWHTTGPLPAEQFGQALFPEQEVDLKARNPDGSRRWKSVATYADGRVNPLPAKNSAATYLYRTATAAQAGEVTLTFGSDDGIVVWVNGVQVLSRDVPRGAAADQDKVNVSLKAGRNALLLKIYNRTGNHAFYFAGPGTGAAGNTVALALEDQLNGIDFLAWRLAVEDMTKVFPEGYPKGAEYLASIARIEESLPKIIEALANDDDRAISPARKVLAFHRETLLANPLLDVGKLLVVSRKGTGPKLGLPQNWQGNCALPRSGYDDSLVTLDLRTGLTQPLFEPSKPGFIGDVDLHFDGDRLLFSMIGDHNRWQVWEMRADGGGLRQVTPGKYDDVDNYDPVYLPDGRIIFGSTRCFHGVPCVGGNNTVANLFIMDADGGNIRQLCFEQDHDWCPTVLNNGRVLYTRWEYTDTAHYFTRILFHMNPDGTQQSEFYGSNSFWPNSLFYARPVPGHPTKIAAIASGHHGVARMGELIILDPAQGRREADGVVQRIPGRGEDVAPVIADQLVNSSWPKFLHPWPLNENYLLVSCQPTKSANWGIYLVDTFDNMTLIKEQDGYAMMEPIPFQARPTPPVIPDKVRPDTTEAVAYIADVYTGPGLKGIPRGTVKNLRVYEYHYAYPKIGGHREVGVESAWEPKRILGTVPVESDGSALFTIPANTPLAVQPLDEQGRAVQLMRSWMTAMPGETLSCVGCHEQQNSTPPARQSLAALRAPSPLAPWYGPARGFSFVREVQPVLDKYCVSCHDGDPANPAPDLKDTEKGHGRFTKSYLALHPFVRRPGPEGDYHLLRPMDFHANTSELVQILDKGHHGVFLDEEAWERLYAWIDFNVPDNGTWTERVGEERVSQFHQRRMEMRERYAGVTSDPEAIPVQRPVVEPVAPGPERERNPDNVQAAGWPFPVEKARAMQAAAAADGVTERVIDLGDGIKLNLVLVPAGEFVMGSLDGAEDEFPRAATTVAKPYWMGKFEITNAQYSRFDPTHDSRYIDQQHKDHTHPGYPANTPTQPVIRVDWKEAQAFCDWLSARTGLTFSLPTEAQWEWACRAGTETPFSFGEADADFSTFANLADLKTREFAVTGVNPQPIKNPGPLDDFLPKDARFNDGSLIAVAVGGYQPNAWGLHDMHGNVWEWTRSACRDYPYIEGDGRNSLSMVECCPEDPDAGRRVVRGGSWRDRPHRATSSYRLRYFPWQKVFNVGFRVVAEAESGEAIAVVEPPEESR